jgi:glycosyltransferase involved in cell wall biosynthesis
MPSPTFSVVIPAYNAADTIDEAIDSLLGQSCTFPYEVIVVNDGSTDSTAAVVEKYVQGVRLLTKPHGGGPGAARNTGVLASNADLILFLDADDRALPGRLERQVQYMLANRNDVDVSFGNWIVDGEHDNYLASYGLLSSSDEFVGVDDVFARLLVRGNFVPTSTSALWRDLYISVGMQPENHFYAEDYMLWCKIAAAGGRFAYSGQPLSWYRTERKGRLTLSKHTYAGNVWVLHHVLLHHGELFSSEDYLLASARFTKEVDVLLRHEWVSEGRKAVLARLDSLAPLVSLRLRRKWEMLTLIPGTVPKAARRLLHTMRSLPLKTNRTSFGCREN